MPVAYVLQPVLVLAGDCPNLGWRQVVAVLGRAGSTHWLALAAAQPLQRAAPLSCVGLAVSTIPR